MQQNRYHVSVQTTTTVLSTSWSNTTKTVGEIQVLLLLLVGGGAKEEQQRLNLSGTLCRLSIRPITIFHHFFFFFYSDYSTGRIQQAFRPAANT